MHEGRFLLLHKGKAGGVPEQSGRVVGRGGVGFAHADGARADRDLEELAGGRAGPGSEQHGRWQMADGQYKSDTQTPSPDRRTGEGGGEGTASLALIPAFSLVPREKEVRCHHDAVNRLHRIMMSFPRFSLKLFLIW